MTWPFTGYIVNRNMSTPREDRVSDVDEEDEEDSECPDSSVCLRLCKDFVTATETDRALAMMFLQQNKWQIDAAVNAYFDSTRGTSPNENHEKLKRIGTYLKMGSQTDDRNASSKIDKKRSNTIKEENTDCSERKTLKIDSQAVSDNLTATTTKESRFKILSWNIDGLDNVILEARTRGVCDVIKREQPDVIFFQEVVPLTMAILESSLTNYSSKAGGTDMYFVAIFTKKDTVKVQREEIIPYPTTQMGRNLLVLHALYNNTIELALMTTHHESCAESSDERKRQLQMCFEQIITTDKSVAVLFGGDLNMRNKELESIGNIPAGVYDLWEMTGKRKECLYTWDSLKNTNLTFSGKWKPRCRFDRLYYRPSNKTSTTFIPVYFELEGMERVKPGDRFPSDHWAIQCYFNT
ncbi:unnamed protein product [Didymodactylos carnosus]|uniref:Tyrosyl-DNA phosphodiesterase 2 n=1 Tax=Didymodactylos carnosus TaxID=1234261 RepID=A0A813R6F6_9BILA|nr:unnamed protein product [Didymodactylos carnosus]CAF0948568.1 unnamed protein product [Didymodactylos carnosus]CAF3559212.1 unnamed protein product [Didymodactylos carnosus]CAF3723012.1 unnamed protein product [Didymodactylos carnosus]